MIRRALVVAAALLASAGASPALGASHTIAVARGQVVRIGDFRTTGRAGSSLGGAIQAFGRPSSRRPFDGRVGCRVAWAAQGIRSIFADLGGGEACFDGRVQSLSVGLRAWRTQRGLHVGDRMSRLRRLHPGATRHRSSWWLYTAISPYGPTPTRYPLLRARIETGRVRSLTAEVGAAGE